MFGFGSQVEFPFGDRFPKKLSLVFGHQAEADLLNVEGLPIELLGFRFQVFFGGVEQGINLDGLCFERDLLGVAKAKIDSGPFSGRGNRQVFETAPIFHNLIVPGLSMVFIAKFLEGRGPDGTRFHVLSTVFVDLCQLIGSLRTVSVGFGATGNFLE